MGEFKESQGLNKNEEIRKDENDQEKGTETFYKIKETFLVNRPIHATCKEMERIYRYSGGGYIKKIYETEDKGLVAEVVYDIPSTRGGLDSSALVKLEDLRSPQETDGDPTDFNALEINDELKEFIDEFKNYINKE